MAANPEGPFEIAMIQDGAGRSVLRPESIRTLAHTLRSWRDAPKTCINCLSAPAVRMVGQEPLCASCRDNRAIRMGSDDLIRLKQETRADLKDGPGFTGYAITFHAMSVDLGGFREIILPEAVNRTIQQGADLRALWNHNSDIVLGRMSAGTLGIVKDQNGLKAEYVPPASASREFDAVERGDVSGQSFGFRAYEDEWSFDGELPTRYVKDMIVSEVSAVAFPAYPSTTLGFGRPRENRIGWLQKKHKNLMARG